MGHHSLAMEELRRQTNSDRKRLQHKNDPPHGPPARQTLDGASLPHLEGNQRAYLMPEWQPISPPTPSSHRGGAKE